MNSNIWKILFSIILGLGLASLFRKVCKGNGCVVIEGPQPEIIRTKVFDNNGQCVQFEPYIVECDKQEMIALKEDLLAKKDFEY